MSKNQTDHQPTKKSQQSQTQLDFQGLPYANQQYYPQNYLPEYYPQQFPFGCNQYAPRAPIMPMNATFAPGCTASNTQREINYEDCAYNQFNYGPYYPQNYQGYYPQTYQGYYPQNYPGQYVQPQPVAQQSHHSKTEERKNGDQWVEQIPYQRQKMIYKEVQTTKVVPIMTYEHDNMEVTHEVQYVPNPLQFFYPRNPNHTYPVKTSYVTKAQYHYPPNYYKYLSLEEQEQQHQQHTQKQQQDDHEQDHDHDQDLDHNKIQNQQDDEHHYQQQYKPFQNQK